MGRCFVAERLVEYVGESNINETLGPARAILIREGWAKMGGVGEAVERRRSVRSVVIITMSEREVPVSVAQRIIIKFLSREGVKPAEILRRLTEQFKEETLSRARV
jgi:hypothetical protein